MMMSKNENTVKMFTCGSDPEFQIRNKSGLVSAVRIIKAGKHNAVKMKSGSMLQHDNVNVEFATKVASTVHDFVDTISKTFRELNEILPANHVLVCNSSAEYPDIELMHPDAQLFGCDPDYNAWTLMMNEAPDISETPNLRSCGGHFHVGQKKGYEFLKEAEGKVLTVQVMDALLGIASVRMDNTHDARRRRKLYGKAGCHRPTEYGVEYRTLSNFWLKSPFLVKLMYSLTQDALNIIDKGMADKLLHELGVDNIQDVINQSLAIEADYLITNKIPAYVSKRSKMYLRKCYNSMPVIDRTSLEHNWKLPFKTVNETT